MKSDLETLAQKTIHHFAEAVRLREAGKFAQANCSYAEAIRLYEKLEEATAPLYKPEPPSNGRINGIEI